jgi:hypothetical protein
MAVSTQDIVNFLKANPGMNDTAIAKAMEQYGITPAQMAQATGLSEGQVVSRIAATIPYGQAKLLGDTWVQPNYQVTGSGENQQIGGIESIQVYKTKGGLNDTVPVGTTLQNYSPTGEFVGTGKTQKVDNGLKEFAIGSALLFGGLGGGFDSLFGGGTGAASTGAASTGAVGTGTGLTGTSLTGTGLSGTGITGTAGSLTGASGLGSSLGTGITGSAGSLAGTAGLGSSLGTGLTVGGGLTGTGVLAGSTLGTSLLGTGVGLAGLTGTGILTGSELGTGLLGTTGTTGLTGTGILTGSDLGTQLLGTGTNTAATVGGVTGLTNAANVGAGALNTGVTTGITGLGNGALTTGVTGEGATGLTTTGTGITGTDSLTSTLGGLTPAQLTSLLQAGLSLGAITGLVNNSTNGTGTTTTTATPTQGVPSNTQGYYNAIQQSYNQMMPNAPRDVMTPLQQWYSGEFSPSSGYSVSSMFKNELPSAQTAQATQPQQQQNALATALAALQKQQQQSQGSSLPTNTAVPTTPVTPAAVVPPVISTPAVSTPATTDGMMSGNAMTPQAQVAALLNNPNLQDLPQAAVNAISQAINEPRAYEDVVSQGSVNTIDLSTLTPAMQKAYDIYQQSQILGVPSSVANAAYKAAGVDPTNPTGFFANLGLQADMPTQEALAKYAPAALSEFAKTGSGGLTFTVDPNTVPKDYTLSARY